MKNATITVGFKGGEPNKFVMLFADDAAAKWFLIWMKEHPRIETLELVVENGEVQAWHVSERFG